MPPEKRKKRHHEHDTVPEVRRRQSTYSLIIDRALQAARKEDRFGRKVTGFTTALTVHSRERFSAMSSLGKLVTSLILIALGAGVVTGGYLMLRPSREALKAKIEGYADAKNWVKAKETLARLRARGELSKNERRRLAVSVEAGVERRAATLADQAEALKTAKKWDDAIVRLEELEDLGVEVEWALFTHAEVLRLAERNNEAAEHYQRYADLFPDTEETDDALFWEGFYLKEKGDHAGARGIFVRLEKEYPGSNFSTSIRRMLQELDAAGR